jgi:hypothetical protein
MNLMSKPTTARSFSVLSSLLTAVPGGCASFAALYWRTTSAPNIGEILIVLI